jgi:hypothetical protein
MEFAAPRPSIELNYAGKIGAGTSWAMREMGGRRILMAIRVAIGAVTLLAIRRSVGRRGQGWD